MFYRRDKRMTVGINTNQPVNMTTATSAEITGECAASKPSHAFDPILKYLRCTFNTFTWTKEVGFADTNLERGTSVLCDNTRHILIVVVVVVVV